MPRIESCVIIVCDFFHLRLFKNFSNGKNGLQTYSLMHGHFEYHMADSYVNCQGSSPKWRPHDHQGQVLFATPCTLRLFKLSSSLYLSLLYFGVIQGKSEVDKAQHDDLSDTINVINSTSNQ